MMSSSGEKIVSRRGKSGAAVAAAKREMSSSPNGIGRISRTMLYDSRQTRDAVLKSPMETGVAASYDRLEKIVTSMPAQGEERESRAS